MHTNYYSFLTDSHHWLHRLKKFLFTSGLFFILCKERFNHVCGCESMKNQYDFWLLTFDWLVFLCISKNKLTLALLRILILYIAECQIIAWNSGPISCSQSSVSLYTFNVMNCSGKRGQWTGLNGCSLQSWSLILLLSQTLHALSWSILLIFK